MAEFEPLIGVDEAAALLGVTRWLVADLARRAAIPAHKIGRYWRFRKSELHRWPHGGQGETAEAALSKGQLN